MKLLEAKDDALIERLNTEGDNSSADLLILADVARLDRAASMNLLQKVDSAALNQACPPICVTVRGAGTASPAA